MSVSGRLTISAEIRRASCAFEIPRLAPATSGAPTSESIRATLAGVASNSSLDRNRMTNQGAGPAVRRPKGVWRRLAPGRRHTFVGEPGGQLGMGSLPPKCCAPG